MALAAAGTEVVLASEPTASAAKAPAISPGQYRVEAMLVGLSKAEARQTPTGSYSQSQVADLIGAHRNDVLSFPQVTVPGKDKSPAVIVATQAGQFPEIILKVTPKGGDTSLEKFDIVYVKDILVSPSDPKATVPVIDTQRLATSQSIAPHSTEGYWCYALTEQDKSVQASVTDGRSSASLADADKAQLLFVKISRG